MTTHTLSRATFLKLTAALGVTAAASACSEPAPAPASAPESSSSTSGTASSGPLLQRFRGATINTPDLKSVADWYTTWLDYQVRDSGTIDAALAESWGAPKMTGKPFTVLSSIGSPDVFIRVVEGDETPAFNPRSTFGWGSIEIILQDLQVQYEKMKAGGVEFFREPASLGGIFESIHAMQLYGPMSITHNLTVETAPPEKSNLPVAKSQVDRIFLMGLNGPELHELSDFYVKNFNMNKGPDYDYPIPVLAEALNLEKDHLFQLTLVRSAQKGNTLELHDFPPPGGPRPQIEGQIPPAVGIVSMGVNSLDEIKVPFLTPPAVYAGAAYNGKRSATIKGAAGELLELIEE